MGRPFSMKVDRPCVTFVNDSATNAVLFAGVIVNPAK
jgi:serine protease inhibitor